MKFFSPAKINLFLKVLGKRSDGYHELATLIQAIDLFDIIHIEESIKDHFDCPGIPDNNLVVRARDLFRNKTGINAPLSIHVEKHIPVEAGLGGGSGNAATTLWAMNLLLGKPATDQQLLEWSAEIGSDIPFFFSKGTAYCTGRGEHVKDVSPINRQWWIVKPSQGASTAQVFGAFKEGSNIDPKYALDQGLYFNDLEAPAKQVVPMLADLKSKLQMQGYDIVQMSGSGTSFFCAGKQSQPENIDAKTYFVNSINRQQDRWYEPKQTS